jgi:hypothetical protein
VPERRDVWVGSIDAYRVLDHGHKGKVPVWDASGGIHHVYLEVDPDEPDKLRVKDPDGQFGELHVVDER